MAKITDKNEGFFDVAMEDGSELQRDANAADSDLNGVEQSSDVFESPYSDGDPPTYFANSSSTSSDSRHTLRFTLFLILTLIVFWLFNLVLSKYLFFAFPFAFIPFLIFLVYLRCYPSSVSFHGIMYAFGVGFWLSGSVVWVYQFLVLILLTTIVVASEQISDTSVTIAIGFYMFFGLAVGQEVGKYVILTRNRRSRPDLHSVRDYLVYSTAGAIGLSTFLVSALEFVFYFRDTNFIIYFTIFLIRMVWSVPLSALTGILIGLGVAKNEVFARNVKAWRILALPITLVFVSDMTFYFLGNFRIVYSVLAYLSCCIVALIVISIQKRDAPTSFLPLSGSEPANSNIQDLHYEQHVRTQV